MAQPNEGEHRERATSHGRGCAGNPLMFTTEDNAFRAGLAPTLIAIARKSS